MNSPERETMQVPGQPSIGVELFSQNGVVMRNQASRSNEDVCPGTLRIVQYSSGKCFEWHPAVSVSSEEGDWAVVSKNDSNSDDTISFDVTRIKEYRVHPKNKRKIVFTLRDPREVYGAVFQTDSVDSLVAYIRQFYRTRRSTRDHHTYKIIEERTERTIQKSFCDLEFDFTRGKSSNPADSVRRLIRDFRQKPIQTALESAAKIADLYRYENGALSSETPEILSQSEESVSIADEYQIVSPTIKLPPREILPRGNPLSYEQWLQFHDAQGRITNSELVKKIIYQGGISSKLRADVWKYLLGYLPWEATTAEQIEIRNSKEKEYNRMKLQWQMVTPAQEARFSDFRDRKSLIEKDVNRCDRSLDFYAGENNSNLKSLHNILMTYIMYNFDLGYVQGMSDLLAPILFIMNNEVDAFWCFSAFMDKVASNFDVDQAGSKRQLLHLHELLSVMDPKFAEYLKNLEPGYLFCFRWLLVIFKREFSYDDTMTIWEAFWTGIPGPNFHLFVGLAILDTEKSAIMDSHSNFAETLKHINELAMKIDVNSTLSKADAIYRQLLAAEVSLPDPIRTILGLEPLQKEPNPLSDSESDAEDAPNSSPGHCNNGLSQSFNDDQFDIDTAIMLNFM
nr:PREDICTED: TBC1 domain family member 15 [Bemisia tabaci]